MAVSEQNVRYGGFWIRLLAGILDSIVLFLLLSAIAYIVANFFPSYAKLFQNPHHLITGDVDAPMVGPVAQLTPIVVSLLYYSILQSSPWQASVGMKGCGLKITNDKYERISFLRALGREIAVYLSIFILFIGFFMIAFTKKKQALHDLIADTYVIRR
jgi:uncharacterized RDD family membrane protein YckC